jgi:hypothetical protein
MQHFGVADIADDLVVVDGHESSDGNHTRADLVSVGMLLFPAPLWANLLYAVVWISFIFLLFNWRKGLWSYQPYFTH